VSPARSRARTLAAVIDLHSHVLPGVDDGAATLYGSIEMARSAVEDGTTVLAATPHVRTDYPTSPATMERLVDEVNEALRAERVPLEVVRGGEVDLERLRELDDGELRRFGLGGNPRYLLVETPYGGWPLSLGETLFGLRVRGFTPVLAHPERNREVQARPELLEQIVAAGTLVQLTAASVDGRLSSASRETAFRLLELGLAHMIASDAHAPAIREIGLGAAAAAVGDGALARWLTEDVPGAIVRGEPLPERPAAPARRRPRLPRLRR
jgi:protein-tyrosine phosphatase